MAKNGSPGRPGATAGGKTRAVDLKEIGKGQRMLDVVPQSYDPTEHTIEMVLSVGGAVQRWYGIEQLSTEAAAVRIDRMGTSGIPFLDSHMTMGINSIVGRIVDVWFAEGKILGRAKFAETDAGKAAEGMVSRGEAKGISIGYRVDAWEVRDEGGTVIDPSKTILDVDDGLTFTATRWELLEVSLVSVPADPAAMVRSHEGAADNDLRATPMGRGAREITVTRGDASVTYRYGADEPHERAWPEKPKAQGQMAKNTRGEDTGAPKDDEKGDRGKRGGKRETPKVDADGNYVDEDGNYVDADGKKVDDPVKADREAPNVDDDGNYVDDEGNYVDENGDPSQDPVKARGEDMDEDDRGSRGKRSDPRRPQNGRRNTPVPLSRSQMAEMVRIGDQARSLNIELDVPAAIERGDSPDALRKRMFDNLAGRSKEKGPMGNTSTVHVLRDEREGRAAAMEVALTTRILASRGGDGIDYAPKRAQDKRFVEAHREHAQRYMGMGFVEVAAECIDYRGNIRNVAQAEDILRRAFASTSDFPAIFQNVLNKSLLARYELAVPTYRQIATERPFADFRPHPQVRAGDFPALQPLTETGELKAGKSFDNGEPVSVTPYGVIFPISRQMLVNDQLGAIDQILGSAGDTVMVFENTTFFNMFNGNPTLNQDGNAVFSAAHNNLAKSAGVISVTNVGAGRASMRAMRSLSNLLLNVPPRIILTGPAQETSADQLVASITPQLTTSVNPFSGKLQSVSDANITDNSWYLMADPARVPCYIYGFLNGSTGPRVRTHEPFGMQGVQISLEHDFGCGAIDYRGAYKNAGALPPN